MHGWVLQGLPALRSKSGAARGCWVHGGRITIMHFCISSSILVTGHAQQYMCVNVSLLSLRSKFVISFSQKLHVNSSTSLCFSILKCELYFIYLFIWHVKFLSLWFVLVGGTAEEQGMLWNSLSCPYMEADGDEYGWQGFRCPIIATSFFFQIKSFVLLTIS